MNLRLTPVWIALALAGTVAHASDDIYFGAGVGAAHFNGLNKVEGVESGTEDAFTGNLFMGYNFNETFGAELGYQYAGRGNTNGGINNNAYENQGATLSGIARLPLGEDFSLFGEAGAYWSHTHGFGMTDSRVSPMAGVGLT